MSTSHELAASLRMVADKLESRPMFLCDSDPQIYMHYGSSREQFIAAAKTLGGRKKPGDYSYRIEQQVGVLTIVLAVWREAVCRIVKPAQPAVFECDPILSADDEAEIEAVP